MANKIKGTDLYQRLQAIYVAELNLRVGDEVKIVTNSDEDVGDFCRNSIPDSYICESARIISIDPNGIEITIDDEEWVETVPFFAIEPTGNISNPVVRLNSDYSAIVKSDCIEVGCQTIYYNDFDKLVEAVNKVRNSN